jgi:salicylate synthetase
VVDAAGTVYTEPVAGTRAFGQSEQADRAARMDLVSDPKEIQEHAVSVYGALLDLAEVIEPGSGEVQGFMGMRERGSVQHLGSIVRGTLRPPNGRIDAFAALFPAVTVSGLPKTESMDAIFRLDGPPRGLYAGSVLTADRQGGFEAAMVLRSVYQKDGRAWLRAGAGIVGRSDPEREFEETCEKLACVAEHLVPKSGGA